MSEHRRIKNKPLIDYVRTFPCMVCCTKDSIEVDHVKTKGSGGDDIPENLMALCAEHHREKHQKGVVHMYETYPGYRTWIDLAGLKEYVITHRNRRTIR